MRPLHSDFRLGPNGAPMRIVLQQAALLCHRDFQQVCGVVREGQAEELDTLLSYLSEAE